jgi:hypothetical protein
VMLRRRGDIRSGSSGFAACLAWSLRFDMHPPMQSPFSLEEAGVIIRTFEEKQNAELIRCSDYADPNRLASKF